MLRGSRDFPDLATYQRFIDDLVGRRNAARDADLRVELEHMQSLPRRRTTDFTETVVTVLRTGGFWLNNVFYSVPSQLIGHRLRVHIYDARVEALAAGDWLKAATNLIAIGNSGSGKTHLLAAVGHTLVVAGYKVLYSRTSDMVQRLQAARRDLILEREFAKLDKFHLLILDDITYAQKDQAETSVLFELIARRYETRSLAVAANQPFSAWEQVFPDKAMTVAAIDRLVHHATILKLNVESYRRRTAVSRQQTEVDAETSTNSDNPDAPHHA